MTVKQITLKNWLNKELRLEVCAAGQTYEISGLRFISKFLEGIYGDSKFVTVCTPYEFYQVANGAIASYSCKGLFLSDSDAKGVPAGTTKKIFNELKIMVHSFNMTASLNYDDEEGGCQFTFLVDDAFLRFVQRLMSEVTA